MSTADDADNTNLIVGLFWLLLLSDGGNPLATCSEPR